ncbi:MAG: YihY/virulence factor BrkB family protein [Pseudomonadota bacterium]
MLNPKKIIVALYKAGENTVNHDGIEHAGYLAFLGLLAFFPLLVFIVALAGFVGEGQAGVKFVSLIFYQLPPDMSAALKPRIAEIISGPPQGLLTLSIFGAIWTSSSALDGYRTVLNRAYSVQNTPSYLFRRLLSVVQILFLSSAAIAAMLALVVMPIYLHSVERITITYISVAIIFIVISSAYYFLPNTKQTISSVVVGAMLVTALWLGATRVLSFYFSRFDQVNLIYGSLGGIIATLLFFYINNIIFIYGAELNYIIKQELKQLRK